MSDKAITQVAVIGTGVIGASWTTYFLTRGLSVVASDPGPGAENACAILDGIAAEVATRHESEIVRQRDEVLLSLLELKRKAESLP